MPVKIKMITAIYVFIIAGIIALADLKGTEYLARLGTGIPYFDKAGHFLLMGGFSFFVNLALKAREISFFSISILLGTLIVLLVVTIEEFSQIFVRGRAFDWGDLLANFVGIVFFGALAKFLYKRAQ